MQTQNAAVAAIQFALKTDEGLAEGPETFRQRIDREFIERNPQFA